MDSLLALSIFGELERTLADLYPYRYVLTALGAVATLGAGALLVRAGVHRVFWQRRIATTVVGIPMLIAALVAGNYLLSPLWERSFIEEETPLAASSAAPMTMGMSTSDAAPAVAEQPRGPRQTHRGDFRGADDFHFARGQAQLIETEPGRFIVRLESFSVRNGPDLYVYLSTGSTDRVEERLNLGRLKATDGAFNYEVPASIDVSKVSSVLVWCKQFGVLFGSAMLQPV